MMTTPKSLLSVVTPFVLPLLLPTLCSAAMYTVTDLGTLGGTDSYGYGINASGQVTGTASTTGNAANHAFLYDSAHGMVDLNSLIDPASGWVLNHGAAINDIGQITGDGTIGGYYHAFLLTPVPEPSSLVLAALAVVGLLACGWRRPGEPRKPGRGRKKSEIFVACLPRGSKRLRKLSS